jgi:hypothetical protein
LVLASDFTSVLDFVSDFTSVDALDSDFTSVDTFVSDFTSVLAEASTLDLIWDSDFYSDLASVLICSYY